MIPVKIFFCYAHEDEQLLDKLKAHLSPLRRRRLIDMWYDREINAGAVWEREIYKHLHEANIILLLVSPDFMNSDFCYGNEMQRALERHRLGEARVIPIILRPVTWQEVLGQLQALPTDAKPIMSKNWPFPDEAFEDVAKGIRRAVEETMLNPTSSFPTMPALPTKTDSNLHRLLPQSDKSRSETRQRPSYQLQQSQYFQEEKSTQVDQFIESSSIVNQQWIPPVTGISDSEYVPIETLFNEAVIAQSNSDLEKALELYQQIRKRDPNFKKGQLTSQLKKLFEQLLSEATRRNDQRSQIHYLNVLLKLAPGNISMQNRLEKVSTTYIDRLRRQATTAREASKWEVEYNALEEILRLRPQDVEANKYIRPAKIKYLLQQAKKARKTGSWDDEVRRWSEIADLRPEDGQAKRRRAIAMKNQENESIYKNALDLQSEGHLDASRETLERLWHAAPYYGDPKRLARKVGIWVPIPLERWRRTVLISLLASLLIFIMISISLSAFHIDSTITWVVAILVVIILVVLSKYWLLLEWLE